MIETPVLVKIPGNPTGLIAYFDRLERVAAPTVGDLLYAGQRERTRILERTARGLDSNETAFAPYSTKGPFYYYPNKGASDKSRHASAGRLANKLGVAKGKTAFDIGTIKPLNVPSSVRGSFKGKHSATRTHLGIKFSSYAAFKQFLGRGGIVDLRGMSAPHMLQALVVKVGGIVVTDNSGPVDIMTPASEVYIGIYGPEAERAEGHNRGTRHLPKRHFLGSNERDNALMMEDVMSRVAARVRLAIAGRGK